MAFIVKHNQETRPQKKKINFENIIEDIENN